MKVKLPCTFSTIMELFIFFIFLPSVLHMTVSHELCESSCGENIFTGPTVIRFPFHLKSNTSRCGYPGFDLLCNESGLTFLTLPQSGQFMVASIDYTSQAIWINDPYLCLPKRFLDSSFNLSNTPFIGEYRRYFTYLNCSSSAKSTVLWAQSRHVWCLSGDNYSVWAIPTSVFEQESVHLPSCTVVSKRVYVPVHWPSLTELSEGARLLWTEPDCVACEETCGTCRLVNDSGSDYGCFDIPKKKGISKRLKYTLISIGVGILGLLCVIGIIAYISTELSYNNTQHHRGMTTELSSSPIPAPIVIVSSGLDGQTIEKYPKIVLGKSRRLPNAGDIVCPICLAEYQPTEILRTIPECNHYFHLDCIDEWLSMNRTCPLCRKSPDSSSSTTPSSVLSSSVSTSPSSQVVTC